MTQELFTIFFIIKQCVMVSIPPGIHSKFRQRALHVLTCNKLRNLLLANHQDCSTRVVGLARLEGLPTVSSAVDAAVPALGW